MLVTTLSTFLPSGAKAGEGMPHLTSVSLRTPSVLVRTIGAE